MEAFHPPSTIKLETFSVSWGFGSDEAARMNPDLSPDKHRLPIQKAATKVTSMTALGKRVQYVDDLNGGKSIRVAQKGWLEKNV